MELAKYFSQSDRLFMYLDLHAHKTRDSAFLSCNYWEELEAALEIKLFARLMDIYSKHFDFEKCIFVESSSTANNNIVTAKSEISKVVANVVHCYALAVHLYKGTKNGEKYLRRT